MVIKGYPVPSGYMGWVYDESRGSGSYILFASEIDYLEYVEEE